MNSDRIAFVSSSWPRLYFDTAEILNIADGRTDLCIVGDLAEAMYERGVLLVVSVEHLQDAIPRANADASVRVADALERFQLRFVVTRDPSQTEPWGDMPGDILIEPASNVREVLMSPLARPVLDKLSSVQGMIHNASVAFQQSQPSRIAAPSKRERDLLLQCMITIIRGWLGTDANTVLAFWEEKQDIALPEATRIALLARLQPFANLMKDASEVLEPGDDQRVKVLATMRDSYDEAAYLRSPGMFLAAQVGACRTRNATRIPSFSDPVDAMHATYFPYVDIATCDRQTYACIAPHLPKILGPRKPVVIPNGHLDDVLEAIRRLPRFPPTC
jgi:hypothetical protein